MSKQAQGRHSITISIGRAGDPLVALSIQILFPSHTHEGRTFLSSKRREDFGTGTTHAVRYLVERYHGILKFDYGNGIFEASLLLNPAMK